MGDASCFFAITCDNSATNYLFNKSGYAAKFAETKSCGFQGRILLATICFELYVAVPVVGRSRDTTALPSASLNQVVFWWGQATGMSSRSTR